MFIGSLPICDNSALMVLLNSIAAGGNPALTGVDLICSKAKWTSLLVCLHFFMAHSTNSMHASTCPLLWWWCNDVTSWFIFTCLQESLNCSETNFVPAPNTNFWVSQMQQIQPWFLISGLWPTGSQSFQWPANYCSNRQCTTTFCY